MADPEIGVNSSNEILKELLVVAKNIQGLLSQKTDPESRAAREINGATNESEGSPEVAATTTQVPPNHDTTITEIVDDNDWPSAEKIAEYRIRCAKHKSECKKMQVELGCFIAHLGIVGGNKQEIEKAESLQKGLLDPVQSLEEAVDANSDGRPTAMVEVRKSLYRLNGSVAYFARSPHQKDALYPDKVNQWWSLTSDGCYKIYYLVNDGEFVECLEFIHDVFFSELESAMGSVVEALTTFEEKFASKWLTTQKIEDSEKRYADYISRVFTSYTDRDAHGRSEADLIAELKTGCGKHRIACDRMWIEMDHLIAHYSAVGGDGEVIKSTMLVQKHLLGPVERLEVALNSHPNERLREMKRLKYPLGRLCHVIGKFKDSLYHQKHAFYFREVKHWEAFLLNAFHNVNGFMRHDDLDRCLFYVCKDLLAGLNEAMIGLAKAPKELTTREGGTEATSVGRNVADELKAFGKESLPKFLVDQMERDTTRYINLTTIATFFSSVTATTLQFTYAPTDAEPSNSLRGVVNLFWFLSLVFSVSSGVSSLLGLTWRKSSIYDSRVPPKLIRMWFDKAPMLFLIIAAVAFVIGLNMFAYLSLQPRYVSFSMTLLTGIHGACLLTVTAWFIYQLKHESVWAGWVRAVMTPISTGVKWIWKMVATGVEWIWKPVKRLYEKYKRNLHLQRNIYWAFGIDNRVARLNYDIDWRLDWPGPYLLSKLIRCIAYPIKGCWLVTKKALSGLSRTVQAHICVSSHKEHAEGDVEMGKFVRREDAKVPEEISLESPAKNEFRESLRTIFSEAECVIRIMGIIYFYQDEIMSNDPSGLQVLRARLWGYPDLIKKLFEVIGPALVEEREKRRREREEAEQQNLTMEQIDDGPEVMAEDKDDTATIPSQSSGSAVVDHGSGLPDVREPESQGQPEDHSSALDERPLPTAASATMEALEPTPGVSIPQTNMEEAAGTPKEIEEVPSTSDNNNEE